MKGILILAAVVVVGELVCQALGFSFIGQMRVLAQLCWTQTIHPYWTFLFGV